MDGFSIDLTIEVLVFSQKNGHEAADRIKMRDAAMFPFYASIGLFGLYLFFKVPALSPTRAGGFDSNTLPIKWDQ